MTREELLEKVNGIEDTTKLKSLSQQTIEEELDEVLDDMSDDETLEDSVVEKLAKRLKRMDGNIHANVSAETKKNRERAKERGRKKGVESVEEDESNDESNDKYSALEAKLNELIAANEAREKAARKKSALDLVRKGLKDKFDNAGLEANDFFIDIAMSKLDVSDDENCNIEALIKKAENIYTSDYKRATGQKAVPRKGRQNVPPDEDGISAHEFDDIIERRKKRFGDVDSKK